MRSRSKSRGAVGVVGLVTGLAMLLVMAVGAPAAFGASEFVVPGGQWPVTFAGKGGTVTLEAESGSKVTCETSSMGGSFASFTRLDVTLQYSGNCELKAAPPLEIEEKCPTITTKELAVQPGDKLNGGTKGGLLFSPASGGVVAEFTCSGPDKVKVHVMGGFICESTPIGEAVLKSQILCKQTAAGHQEFTSIEIASGLIKTALEADSTFGIFELNEQDALGMTENVTWSAAVEQTA